MKKVLFLSSIFMFLLFVSNGQGTWTQKAPCPGGPRGGAVGININGKGYFGTGLKNTGSTNDFWEYNPSTDTWTQKASMGVLGYTECFGFSINKKGYVEIGNNGTNDVWEYNPLNNTWTQKANFPGSYGQSMGFVIGDNGYVIVSNDMLIPPEFWEYNPINDVWTQKTWLSGPNREDETVFAIGNKGYLGLGEGMHPQFFNDFWEYNPTTDVWTQKANFPGCERDEASGFSIGSYGFLGLGGEWPRNNDFWLFDPASNTWMQVANFPGTKRSSGIGISIGNKGYIAFGGDSLGALNELWEFDPGNIGINEFKTKSIISISPNPFTQSTQITLPQTYHNIALAVYDIQGKLLAQMQYKDCSQIQLNRNQLSNGLYFLKLTLDEKEVETGKIVIRE